MSREVISFSKISEYNTLLIIQLLLFSILLLVYFIIPDTCYFVFWTSLHFFSSSPPWESLPLCIWHFVLDFTYKWNMFSFCAWLISFLIMFSRFVHIAATSRIFFSRLSNIPLYKLIAAALCTYCWWTPMLFAYPGCAEQCMLQWRQKHAVEEYSGGRQRSCVSLWWPWAWWSSREDALPRFLPGRPLFRNCLYVLVPCNQMASGSF